MITVEEADQIISQNTLDFGVEEIDLNKGIGRVLREPIAADRDFPPYDRVTMDGIAIAIETYEKGTTVFPIEGIAAAGSVKQVLRSNSNCLEVMTGTMMPEGTNAVVPYEQISINEGKATLTANKITRDQNIHFKGQDRKKGEDIIQPGGLISSSEIGVCATVGKAKIKVSRLPRAIVISSGDELVDIDQTPEPHQIRRSNVYRLVTLLNSYHIQPDTAHLLDDYDSIVLKLKEYLETYDLIILSGGVSMGKFDFLPSALDELVVNKLFHKIKQRPGKPFWFGKLKKTTVFAFPGNPVSSFMCARRYFKPWLDQCLQLKLKPQPKAVLAAEVSFAPDLTYFLEARIDYSEKGELLAIPVRGNGSGDLANLVDADAFIELPRGRDDFHIGEVCPLIFYR